MGHLALILYSYYKKTDPVKAQHMTDKCKYHWQRLVDYQRDTVMLKDNMWNTIQMVLKSEDLSHLSIV